MWARSGAKTNDEKAIALYDYLHQTIFHRAYPMEAAPQSVGPLKVIHAYGWNLCGGQHTILKALYEAAGWKCRYVGWPGHTTVEVFYDGRWHYLDVFLKCYYWTKDRGHIASQEEIAADPSIVLDAPRDGRAARNNLCCGDLPADVVAGCKARTVVGDAQGWAGVTGRDENYSPALSLPAGASLRLDWKPEPQAFVGLTELPQHTCGTKDFRGDRVLGPLLEHYGPRNWSNGVLDYEPEFRRPTDIALTKAAARDGKLVADGRGSALFKVPLPYPYVRARLDLAFEGGDGRAFLSTDGGTSWQPVKAGDVSDAVRQHYAVWLRVEFPGALTRLHLAAVVEHNRSALPCLLPGKNTVRVSAADDRVPERCRLTVTYAYQEATVPDPARRTRFEGEDVRYSPVRQVTKEITTLPFTFDIDVGGNTPPKMLSLERSVRAGGSP